MVKKQKLPAPHDLQGGGGQNLALHFLICYFERPPITGLKGNEAIRTKPKLEIYLKEPPPNLTSIGQIKFLTRV